MSPSQWGPPTWLFMHTLAEKIKEDSYPIIGKQLIYNIIQICNLLPCPDCSEHSKTFWNIESFLSLCYRINIERVFLSFISIHFDSF